MPRKASGGALGVRGGDYRPPMLELIVMQTAPIPVGHRVEITWHEEVQEGLAGQTRIDWRPHQPVIRDLETGIEYATDWGFGRGGRTGPDLPAEVGEATMEDFRVRDQVTGVVRRCRVVTVHFQRTEVQTHLLIETA